MRALMRRVPAQMRIAVLGAGATGSYIGGMLAHAGVPVVLVDMWAKQVDYLKENELQVEGPRGAFSIGVEIAHIYEVAGITEPFDLLLCAVNGYDLPWALTLMEPLLKPEGWVIPFHDGVHEERVAAIVGRDRTMGLVVDRLGAIPSDMDLNKPGRVHRVLGENPRTFIVGELDGSNTPRLRQSVELLSAVAGSVPTNNLENEHWSKLPRDCTRSPLTTLTGLSPTEAAHNKTVRRLAIALIAEVVSVGVHLGHQIEPQTLMGISPGSWLRAMSHESELEAIERQFMAAADGLSGLPRGASTMARQLATRRRTEIDYLNGYVVAKSKAAGVRTPLNTEIVRLVKKLEQGSLRPTPEIVDHILEMR